MKNKYIDNKGYYIREDLNSFLLYYDFVSQGLSLPSYCFFPLIQKLVHNIVRYLIIVSFVLGIYKMFYTRAELNDNAIIVIEGKGNWGSLIKLVEKNGELKILKKVKSDELYYKEKKFYETYIDNITKIKLPHHIFHGNRLIEIDFLPKKTFQRLILEGSYDLKDAMRAFDRIKSEIKILMKEENALVHGDLWPGNIIIKDNMYYLIDFSDSHINVYTYDMYTLLYSLLSTFHLIKINEFSIAKYIYDDKNVADVINANNKQLSQIETKFRDYREKRFPGVYYN